MNRTTRVHRESVGEVRYGQSETEQDTCELVISRRRNDEEEGVDRSLHQSAVCSLLYLSTRTRPDISFSVSNVAKYCNDPSKEHWIAVKRILHYLNGSTHLDT